MIMAFVKIFETTEHGQLCVMKDTDDEERPAIMVYCHPRGMGVCKGQLSFSDDDDGWERQEVVFDKFTVEGALETCKLAFEMAADI